MTHSFLLNILVLGISLAPFSVICGDEPEASSEATDALFPAAVEDWKNAENELAAGIVKSEQLRARLLEPAGTHRTGAAAIAELIQQFQQAAKPNDQRKALLRHGVQSFDVSGDRLFSQIRGDTAISPMVFDAFDGRWFGRWEQMDVNHDWRPSVQFMPPTEIAKNQPPIRSLQYAWISDGFGWNYLSARDGNPNQNYVLGMVYYFSHPNYRDITTEKPHVGFADSPTRLIWTTEFEVYLEEAFPESVTGEPNHYVITGLRHDLFGDTPSISPKVVQATYTRDPSVRPAFQKTTWKANEK